MSGGLVKCIAPAQLARAFSLGSLLNRTLHPDQESRGEEWHGAFWDSALGLLDYTQIGRTSMLPKRALGILEAT